MISPFSEDFIFIVFVGDGFFVILVCLLARVFLQKHVEYFVRFGLLLYDPGNRYGHSGMVSSPNYTYPAQT